MHKVTELDGLVTDRQTHTTTAVSYCNCRVCLYVCMSVCLSVCLSVHYQTFHYRQFKHVPEFSYIMYI